MPQDNEDAFGGNESWTAVNVGPALDVQPVRSEPVSRLVGSAPVFNRVTVPRAGINTNVLGATAAPREVSLQNVGSFPVWITNGVEVAPNGWRLGALDSIKFVTDQAIYLCTLPVQPLHPTVVTTLRGEAEVIVSG